jgi:hypothetical protein
VAAAILDGAERPRRDVVVGGAAKAQLLAPARLPPPRRRSHSQTGHRLQKSADPKSPEDADALDQPVQGDDRHEGVVSTLHKMTSANDEDAGH